MKRKERGIDMKDLIWLWKHRHCCRQLKYLYEHRHSLKLILAKVSLHPDAPDEAVSMLASLRELDRIPLPREWMVAPPKPPSSGGRIEKAVVFPTDTDKPNPFLDRLDPKLEKQKNK